MYKYLKTLMKLILASSISILMPFAQAADIKDRSFKIAFVQPKDHPQAIALERFAEIVDKRSGGKLKIKVFAGGTLGGDAAVIQSLQGGTIEGTMVATSLLGGQIKEFAVLDFPYLFNDGTEADAVLDGPVGRKLNEKLPSKGLVGISFWEHGFRNMTNSRRPINTLADFQGLKIRVLQLPLYVDMFNTLGSNAVPMPYPELYTGMETKTVDGQENTFSSIETAKFYEVQKYASTTKHVYQPLILMFSKKIWDTLSKDEQEILLVSGKEAQPFARKIVRDADAKSLASLKDKGLIVTDFSPASVNQMRDRLKPVIEKFSKEAGEDFVKEVQSEIQKVRSRK